MLYNYILRDCLQQRRPVPVLVRKAAKQSGSFAVLADEQPTGEQRQVLLMQGRQGRDRVPLVLNDDSTVANIIGSVLCRVQDVRLVGVLGFASDSQAQATREQYLAGGLSLHLITNPVAGVELQRGESFHGFAGPAQVLTKWEPLQVVLSDT